ncbi:MAG: XRE family transcriptional regulator, partial [Cyclobacteriaceae bacterium]|nr:XRE family transcriptional regulator [Cyclobacteriaceae bacterium]
MLKDDVLSEIGKRIKAERVKRGMNLQEVADLAGVTAGLLSKIENFRTVPSLPVLLNISKSLQVNMYDLVENIENDRDIPFLLVKKAERVIEEREDSVGLIYESLVHQDIANINFRANIVKVKPHVTREPLSTDAMELIYVICGSVTYGFKNKEVTLEEGDSLYFDGAFAHSLRNNAETTA